MIGNRIWMEINQPIMLTLAERNCAETVLKVECLRIFPGSYLYCDIDNAGDKL